MDLTERMKAGDTQAIYEYLLREELEAMRRTSTKSTWDQVRFSQGEAFVYNSLSKIFKK